MVTTHAEESAIRPNHAGSGRVRRDTGTAVGSGDVDIAVSACSFSEATPEVLTYPASTVEWARACRWNVSPGACVLVVGGYREVRNSR